MSIFTWSASTHPDLRGHRKSRVTFDVQSVNRHCHLYDTWNRNENREIKFAICLYRTLMKFRRIPVKMATILNGFPPLFSFYISYHINAKSNKTLQISILNVMLPISKFLRWQIEKPMTETLISHENAGRTASPARGFLRPRDLYELYEWTLA